MHTLDSHAHGLFAAAMVNALAQELVSKNVLDKSELLNICAKVKATFDAAGVRHNSAAETDAALLTASLAAEINSRFLR